MKKIYIFIVLTLCLILPISVKADMLPPISVESYANEATVGSIITYKIMGNVYKGGKVGITNLNGKITYNASQLEYVDIDFGFPNIIEGELPPVDVNIISNKNGVLEYKVVNEYGVECRLDLLISFKVKSLPTTGNLKVNFTPEDISVTYGENNIEIEMEVLNNDNTTEDNSNNNNTDIPSDEENNNDDTDILIDEENNDNNDTDVPSDEENNDNKTDYIKEDDTDKNTDNSKDNNLYYYLMIASIVLNIVFIILLVINYKKNKTINVNQNN